MSTEKELLDLEREAWKALSTDGETAAAFYERVLAERVIVLLPGGMVIDDRSAVVDSMRGAPWSTYELSDERVLSLGEDAAVVTYRVAARRGEMDYAALLNSTYVRSDGRWQLAVHQQTPI